MVGRNYQDKSGCQNFDSKAVTIIWCVCTWMKKTKSSSFQCRAICCPRIGYRPPYYRGLTLPGRVGKSHQQIVRFSRQSLRSPPRSKKYWFDLEPGLGKLADTPPRPPFLVDLWDFQIWGLNLHVSVDAIGPETHYTRMKECSPSGHQLVTMCSSSCTKNMDF